MISKQFLDKVLERVDRLNRESLEKLLFDLREDRDFLQLVLDSFDEGIVVLDNDINVVLINKKGIEILAITEDNVLHKQLNSSIPHNLYELLVPILNRFGENQLSKASDVIFPYPYNKIIETNVLPGLRGQDAMIVVLKDVTKQREEQSSLEEAEKQASLTYLASRIAHEIKNPLAAMDIHLQLLEGMYDYVDDEHKSKFEERINVLEEEVTRLDRIVKDFLFSARPVMLLPSPVNMKKVLTQIYDLLKVEFQKKKIHLRLALPNEDRDVFADIRFIQPVITNLLRNSLEACQEDDQVILTLAYGEDNYFISVEDSGTGIDESDIPHIFEPYFTKKASGTGLGLTTVYKVVKEHGGSILLDTKLNHGTTFSITLPNHGPNPKQITSKNAL